MFATNWDYRNDADLRRTYNGFASAAPSMFRPRLSHRKNRLHPMASWALDLLNDSLNNDTHSESYRHSLKVMLVLSLIEGSLKGALAALIHDVGKREIDPSVLYFPGPLNPEQRALVQTHAQWTRTILGKYKFAGHFEDLIDIASNHHELLDGNGYPAGLTGDDLCAITRALTGADIGEALISDRVYKKGMPVPAALALMEKLYLVPGKVDASVFERLKQQAHHLERIAAVNSVPELYQWVVGILETRSAQYDFYVSPNYTMQVVPYVPFASTSEYRPTHSHTLMQVA